LKTVVTVGLLWHSFGSGNLGVGALTESNIAIVARVLEDLGCRASFRVFGTGESHAGKFPSVFGKSGHTIDVRPFRLMRRSFTSEVEACDLVLDIGEGDSFTDIYGFKRFFYLWLSKRRVIWAKCPLVLCPQTIGPFQGKTVMYLARRVMEQATRVFARDHSSMILLKSMGLERDAREVIDVAFALPYDPPTARLRGTIRVGLNVSALLFHGGYSGDNQFTLTVDYRQFTESLIEDFSQRTDVELHLVAHVVPDDMLVEDDYALAKSLQNRFENIVLAPRFESASQAKSYIAGLDFFSGARMHACIAAFSAGIPVIPFAYSRKFNGLFSTLGYEHIADGKILSTEAAVRAVLDGFERREHLRELVNRGNAIAASRLGEYEVALRELFGKLAHGS
jgi:colanic acid/amylovoran biosynthesis protein